MKKIRLGNYETLLFFLVRAPFVGICSKSILYMAKQDSWISLITAVILGFIPLWIYYKIITKYPSKNILEIVNTVFGNKLGYIINIILALFVLFFAAITFGNLLNFIGSQYLYKTPEIAILITFLIPVFYSLRKGLTSILHTTTIIFYIVIILYSLSIIGLFLQVDISNIYPIFEHGIPKVLQGTYTYIAYNVIPIFILTIIPYNEVTGHEKFVKKTILFYILASISLFIVCFYTISIYGINFANLIQYPEFHLLKRLTIVGSLQRFENILSLQWVFDIFIYVIFACYYIESFLIKITKKIPKLKDNVKKNIIDLIIIICLSFLSTKLFKNNTEVATFLYGILPSLSFIFFFIIPMFIKVKKPKKIMPNA